MSQSDEEELCDDDGADPFSSSSALEPTVFGQPHRSELSSPSRRRSKKAGAFSAVGAAVSVMRVSDMDTRKVFSSDNEQLPYIVMEKMDGFRLYWDGRQLRFRRIAIHENRAPPLAWSDEMRRVFGDVKVDGELYAGRGNFHQVGKKTFTRG